MRFTHVLTILILTLINSYTAIASVTVVQPEQNYTLDNLVVSSSRTDDYIENHPQDVNVVKRSEILERNISTVEEILKTIPGVDVYPSGVGSRISIRGSGKSGGVLLLINGRPLNSNNYGSMDLNSIPVDIIETIMVFKPPVPVWLGPGGSDGAINIITRNTKISDGKSNTTIRGEGGSYGLLQSSVSHLLNTLGGQLLLSGNYIRRDGLRPNSDKNEGNASFNWNHKTINATRYEINGRYFESEYGLSGPLDNLTPNARKQYRKAALDGKVSDGIGENGIYTLNTYTDLVNVQNKSQSGYIATLNDRKGGIKFDTTWSHDGEKWELRLGGMSEINSYEHSLTGRHVRFRNNLNSQFDKRFGNFTVTAGARGDLTNDFGFNPGGALGLGWGITDNCLIKARVGYVSNIPTFEQLYQGSYSIDQSQANPDLKTEKVLSYSLGIEYTPIKNSLLQATLFRVDTYDMITFQRNTNMTYRPINISGGDRQGIELSAKYTWKTGFSADITLVYQGSSNKSTGKELAYTPDVKFKTTLQYILPKFDTRLEGSIRYEGNRYGLIDNLPSHKLDEYVTLDIMITQPVTIMGVKANIYGKVYNLLNEAYMFELGYPDDGIRALGGVQLRF